MAPIANSPIPSIAHFVKLNGANYFTWRKQLISFLNGYDLMKYVDGTFPAPSPNSTSNDGTVLINPEFVKWFQRDQLIIHYITGVMETDMIALLGDASTSYQVWDTLRRYFAAQSVVNEANLRFQLYSLDRGSESVSQYMQGAKRISDTLATIGQSISSKELVTCILRGLGPDYHTIVTTILNTGTLPEFEDLRARLLTYENQLAHSAHTVPNPTALLSYNPQQAFSSRSTQSWNKTSNNKKKWNKNQKSPKGQRQPFAPQTSAGILGQSPIQCQLCGTPGHLAPICPTRSSIPASLQNQQFPPQSVFAGMQTSYSSPGMPSMQHPYLTP